MCEWKDKTTSKPKNRTSRTCAKTGPATNISACQQMAIAVMLLGKACDRSKIYIFMIASPDQNPIKSFFI